MACLVTVGSTQFEALTTQLDLQCEKFVKELEQRGINKLLFQIGTSKKLPARLGDVCAEHKIKFECFEFTKNFKDMLSESKLVISHAGAGSISETLSLKKPLLVVVNETLMDNHQVELATAMAEKGYLYWAKVSNVLEILEKCDFNKLKEYPRPQAKKFADLIDEQVGFET
eukprot:CAMPEP_0114512196 /NCGR_PEP_ID=MMETSP0109-20121206/14834_1 /TAXON_ID=29199 /ORGANISM="Chlorarachnion reptans, Strain CCCM449" /LENGTH=170 /DNA_ID=CAMNT_0001691839 /DNA_START=28 /DNA_END=540 /DNA_ORIENTATION=-